MPERLVPNPLLFRATLTIRRLAEPPSLSGLLEDWTDEFRLPCLAEMDGLRPFADVWMGWHETGLFLAVRVHGRREPPTGSPSRFWEPDGLRLFTDTRDTRNIHRAGRYCQQWYFLPRTGDEGSPAAGSAPIHRAKENAPAVPAGKVAVASRITGGNYAMEAMVPAVALAGFDPEAHGRIGLYYYLADRELGAQYLTVGEELPYYTDPSLWASAVLAT